MLEARHYIGGIEYIGSDSSATIDLLHTEEGIARKSGGSYAYEYFLRDHLGNTRIVFNGSGTVLQQTDYLPFGMEINRKATSPKMQYTYNGKEYQPELNQYDYGARFYDPVIGRWHVVDPMAENYYAYSAYNYVLNDPIGKIDPDGMTVEDGFIDFYTDPDEIENFIRDLKAQENGRNQGEYFAPFGGALQDGDDQKDPKKKKKVRTLNAFGTGFAKGFGAGVGSTVDFFKSLGSTQGWKDFGLGVMDLGNLSSMTSPQGMLMRSQLADASTEYIQNIPNMSAYELGYDLGYGTEKALEIGITRRIYTGEGIGIGNLKFLSNTTLRGTTLLKTGKNFRIDLDLRNGMHYHRRGPGGIGRHRPWQVKSGDNGNFWKRF